MLNITIQRLSVIVLHLVQPRASHSSSHLRNLYFVRFSVVVAEVK